MTVHSPKLEHLKNEGRRQVPLFPQVQTVLKKLWAESSRAETYVLPKLRRHKNPGVPLSRIIKSAKLKAWPDLLRNLRQSAINDAEHNPRFTAKNISDWFGNSEATRRKHYSRTLIDDINAAADGSGESLDWMTDDSEKVSLRSQKASETG